jgi:hypothetical protein
MTNRVVTLIIATLLLINYTNYAQGEIEIFGYGQASFNHFENWYNVPIPADFDEEHSYNFMGIAQMNLMLAKQFTPDLSAFVNFEFINDYSSSKGFGTFNLQEAYIRWDHRNYLKVKFGMIIPQFNNLYEIYNRTPLLPYLIRPKVYEANFGNLIDVFDFLPQKALVQINGNIPTGGITFQYALWGGNPPSSLISSSENDLIPGYTAYGQSAVNFLSFGGRVGVINSFLKAGFSITKDTENRRNIVIDWDENTADFGDIDRLRIGADLSLSVGDFRLEGEYLMTRSKTTQEMDDSLDYWYSESPDLIGNNFDKYFYYISAIYSINDDLTAFIMYDAISDNFDSWFFGKEGYKGFHLGVGYSLIDEIVLKVQYNKNTGKYDSGIEDPAVYEYSESYLSLGASFSF